MLQPKEELQNLIIEYPSNNNNICERCKNAEVTMVCSECSPFHNYCQICDEIIHQLPSRINHNRQNITNNNYPSNYRLSNSSQNIILNNPISKDMLNNNSISNNISLQNRTTYQFSNSKSAQNLLNEIPDINNINNNLFKEEMPQFISNDNTNNYNSPQIIDKSPRKSLYSGEILNNPSLNMDMNMNNLNNIEYIDVVQKNRDEDYKKTYSKEYILELQNIHQKEKNELLFKISSLENTLDRIKKSFNEQIKKMQMNQNSNEKDFANKIDNIKENYNLKLKNIEKEKDLEISLLKEQLVKEKDNNNQLIVNLEKIKGEYRTLKNNSVKNIDDINNELTLIKNEYDDFRRETDKIIDKLKKEYENKIKNIIESNENQKENANIKHKMELDNMETQINLKNKQTIQDLKNENLQLRQDNTILVEKITEIENDLQKVHKEYNNTANEYNNAANDLNVTINQKISENNELVNKIDELNKIL